MENNFFGEKDVFAIELRDYDLNRKLGRVRFWLNGKQYGDLKRKDEMEDVIEGLEMLIAQRDSLYDQSFDSMTNEQIFSYCLFLNKDVKTFTEEDYTLFKRMRSSFAVWFGEQFDNVTHITYYKDDFYHFLWSYNDDYSGKKINYLKNLEYEKVPKENFETAVSLFLLAVG